MRRAAPLAGLLLFLSLAHPAAAQQTAPTHPLDGLQSAEYWTVYETLRDAGRLDSTTAFSEVTLREPPKAEVLSWKPGGKFRREARVTLRRGVRTYEAVVDVSRRRVLSFDSLPNVQAPVDFGEYEEIGSAIKGDAQVRAALARRGITDLGTIRCGGGPAGYYGTAEHQSHVVLRGGCSDRVGTYNGWSRQIPGLTIFVDRATKKVLRVVDVGTARAGRDSYDFTDEAVGVAEAAHPLVVSQPMGPGFTRQGGEVAWEQWRFHVRVDPRVGLVVSRVRWVDGNRERSVMYQGHLSEIFVPYMDSTTGWYDRNFLDAGEYAAEGMAESLEPGVDCPAHASYIDTPVMTGRGTPMIKRRVACLFERASGQVAWRHGEENSEYSAGRPARDLVLRMVATVGNYDYLFDWTFQQNGSLRVAVGATGILEVKPVQSRMIAMDQGARAEAVAPRDDAFGRLLAPGVVGVNHDHFFSFRLDLDVDGTSNSLAVDSLARVRLPDDHPRRSLWTVQERIARTEKAAQLDMNMHAPALWRVVSADARGPLGYATSYEIAAGHNAMSLLADDDWPQRRAGFIRHQLWVTPYAPTERYAAGDYPTFSNDEYGLATWTRADRRIEATDIVAWYTLGFHHVPRAEDWPVMPTAWHDFELRPFDFFPQNPALGLPRTP